MRRRRSPADRNPSGCTAPWAGPRRSPGPNTHALIRLLTPTEQRGQRVCLDHAHHLLDQLLMAQTEAPA